MKHVIIRNVLPFTLYFVTASKRIIHERSECLAHGNEQLLKEIHDIDQLFHRVDVELFLYKENNQWK